MKYAAACSEVSRAQTGTTSLRRVMKTILLALSRSMPSPVPLDEAAQDDAASVGRDRGVEEVDLALLADLDVLVGRGRVRRGAPQHGLRRLEALGLDVEAVLGPERAALAGHQDDVVLLDDRLLGLLEAVVVERERRLPGAGEPEEEEADVAELAVRSR